ELLGDAVGLVISIVILWYTIVIVATSARDDAKIIKILIIPEWWVFAIVAVSALLLIVEFICRMWRARTAPPPVETLSI
ncbi:MAG: TRAP transporter small permease subunit, partial [Candidatus Eiseniibacteriota bacterium]